VTKGKGRGLAFWTSCRPLRITSGPMSQKGLVKSRQGEKKGSRSLTRLRRRDYQEWNGGDRPPRNSLRNFLARWGLGKQLERKAGHAGGPKEKRALERAVEGVVGTGLRGGKDGEVRATARNRWETTREIRIGRGGLHVQKKT